jgi:hypothetical protein
LKNFEKKKEERKNNFVSTKIIPKQKKSFSIFFQSINRQTDKQTDRQAIANPFKCCDENPPMSDDYVTTTKNTIFD